jgi:hypothetical protein
MEREERIKAVALAIMAKRYPHLSHEEQVEMAKNRQDEARAALDSADSTRDPCDCRQCHLDSLPAVSEEVRKASLENLKRAMQRRR